MELKCHIFNFLKTFCRYQCPDQCESATPPPQTPKEPDAYGAPAAPPVQDSYGSPQSPVQSYSAGGNAVSRRRREATEEVEIGEFWHSP